jgi:hypothetical protein
MNSVANIWNHPKTSVAGLLIAIATIAGVLSQHGITLGTAGSGTVVSLLGALATALLGLFAKDPDSQPATTGNTAKLGVWMLIALLLQAPFLTGCSEAKVAQDIVNWTPALQSAVATVDSMGDLLDPSGAPVFAAATAGFDAASNLLVAQARTYLSNPSASALAQLQTAVVTLQQQVNASLLQAARIGSPGSQQHALDAINAVGTVVNAMLALVQSVSSKSAVAKMAASAPIKLAAVRKHMNPSLATAMVAAHYSEAVHEAYLLVACTEAAEIQSGF